MSDEITLPPRPALFINVAGKQIKMTYGLEMDLRRMLPDPVSALQLIQSDTYTQDYLVRRVLTEKKSIITDPAELIGFDDVDIDSEAVENILSWVTEHALYFFMKRALKMAELGVQYQVTAPQQPSSNGSESSPLTTPSAGDSVS